MTRGGQLQPPLQKSDVTIRWSKSVDARRLRRVREILVEIEKHAAVDTDDTPGEVRDE